MVVPASSTPRAFFYSSETLASSSVAKREPSLSFAMYNNEHIFLYEYIYTGVDYALLLLMELVKDRIRDQHWKRIPKAFGGQPTVEIAMRYAALLSAKFGAERRDFCQKLLRWKNERNLFCHKPCAPDALQRRQHMLDMLRNVLAIINKICVAANEGWIRDDEFEICYMYSDDSYW